jgi:hypothetical protein
MTHSRRCFRPLLALPCLALLFLPGKVLGQKEAAPLDFRIRPLINNTSPASPTIKGIVTEIKPSGGPTAKIHPENLKVKQGTPATFRNVSLADLDVPLVRILWTGPANQRGQSDLFDAVTSNLPPGSYPITLEVFDRRKRSSKTNATLEVFAATARVEQKDQLKELLVIPRVTPDFGRQSSPPPVKPFARIRPERPQVPQGEKAVFMSASTPEGQVRERWTGPGNQTGADRRFEVDTNGLTPGPYAVELEVLGPNKQRDRATARLEVTPPPVKPIAKIRPDSQSVEQGRSAVFESQSTPKGLLKEKWTGPRNQEGQGHIFEIPTETLSLRQYVIRLEVFDREQNKAKTQAMLHVLPTPEKPEVKDPPPRVRLSAKPNPAKKGESIFFEAKEEPPRKNLEYRFDFGDDQVREWSPEPAAKHFYANAGTYQTRVGVRIRGKEPWPGDPKVIIVQITSVLPPNRWILTVLAFVAGGGYLLLRKIQKIFPHRAPRIVFKPMTDPGEQGVNTIAQSGIETEIRIRSITDGGVQDIETVGSLISEERRGHE